MDIENNNNNTKNNSPQNQQQQQQQQSPSQILLNQIHHSVIYLKGLNENKQQILNNFNELLNDSQSLTAECKSEITMQLKWFKYFFEDYSEDENIITKKHINLKQNIFNMYQKYIKDIKSNYYSLFNIDLKYLPSLECTANDNNKNNKLLDNTNNNNQRIEYDSLRMSVAISQLILYLYYYFLNKHDNIYLTNEMFSDKLNLIDIVSISHIDYIIYVYENLSCQGEKNDNEIEQQQSQQLEDEEQDEVFELIVKNYEEEIEQFDNFLSSLSMISEYDEKIIEYIPNFEQLYGYFLAKQQTIEMCMICPKKKLLFETYYTDVVEKCIFNCSIPNNKYIDKKSFNFYYLHPYLMLNHLTFDSFLTSVNSGSGGSSSQIHGENKNKVNILFYDKIYNIILNSFNKIFQNNCAINIDSKNKSQQQQALYQQGNNGSYNNINKNNSKSSSSKNNNEDKKKKRMELQKCLNLIQETIIVSNNAESSFIQLAEQIITNLA